MEKSKTKSGVSRAQEDELKVMLYDNRNEECAICFDVRFPLAVMASDCTLYFICRAWTNPALPVRGLTRSLYGRD